MKCFFNVLDVWQGFVGLERNAQFVEYILLRVCRLLKLLGRLWLNSLKLRKNRSSVLLVGM